MITDHGRPTVAVMDAELAKLALQVLEDSRDVEQALARLERVDQGERTFSLDEVAAEFGITLD